MFPKIARIWLETASRDGANAKSWALSFGYDAQRIGANRRAVVLKVTQLGLLVQTSVNLKVHDKLKVYLSTDMPVEALIVRQHEDHFDAVFANPVSHSALSALRLGGVGEAPILDLDDCSVARSGLSTRDLDPMWLLWSILMVTFFIVSLFVYVLASLPVVV